MDLHIVDTDIARKQTSLLSNSETPILKVNFIFILLERGCIAHASSLFTEIT